MTYAHAGQYTARMLTANLSITVLPHGSNTPATLYTDRTKTTTAPNPITSDGTGLLTFFAAPGDYDLATAIGVFTVLVPVDPADLPAPNVSDPLAAVADVTARLGTTPAPPDDLISALLDDASAVVRTIAQRPWPNPATAPAVARTVVLRLVLTAIRNPDGLVTETDGDYSYTRAPDFLGSVTDGEKQLILDAAGRSSLASTHVARDLYVDMGTLGLAAVAGGGDQIPLGADPLLTEPWTPGDPDATFINAGQGPYGDGLFDGDFGDGLGDDGIGAGGFG